ncbi:MAG: SIMPL domain-containing protein [Pyrinomonadaceae bacterium]|nr:SIMPL domain-containing protein [Pyrinomonadaceae bacterium]
MKRTLLLLSFFAFLLFSAKGAAAQIRSADGGIPTIEVTGKSEISVEPDSATISVDFTKLDKDLQAARRANEDGVAKMLQIARKYGIPPKDVRTNNISVAMKFISIRDRQKPIYDEDGDEIGTREFQGYEVSRSVTITLTKLDDFDALFNEILATQPTEIDNVKFETSRLIELRQKAREMAMKAAYDKARSMTGAIGQTLGKAIKITEGTASDKYYSNSNFSANSTSNIDGAVPRQVSVSNNLATFSAGSITVESSVTVVFRLD